jgi:hypothetical protein
MSDRMIDEGIAFPTEGHSIELTSAELEHVLETLIVLAHNQRRNFLAYLLVMALMHVRDDDRGKNNASH